MAYNCDADDGLAAIVIITQLGGDADTMAWCGEHWTQFVLTAAAQLGGGEPQVTETPSDPTTGDASDEPEAQDETALAPGEVDATPPPTEPPAGDGEHVEPVAPEEQAAPEGT